jgi:predicted PurR-regulated permease PerM
MIMEKPGMKAAAVMIGMLLSIILFGHFLRHTFAALMTALVLSYLFNPLFKYLQRRGFDRLTALVLMYGIGALAAFVASFLFIPYLGHQLDAFVKSFPGYVQSLQHAMEGWKTRIAPYYAGDEGDWLLARAEESLTTLAAEVSDKGYEQFKGILFGLFDLLLAPVLIFFLLYYKQYYKDTIKRLLPLRERRRLTSLGGKINRTLERFIVAMFIDCMLVGLLTALALTLLGVEFPVLNGLFAGFASVIPFLGVAVAVIPAALIGYAKSGDLSIIPKVCLAYFIINVLLEGNIIKPLIMRRSLRLNPLAVIFAIMALGEWLGFWGIVLAVPVAALAKICVGEVRQIVRGEGGDP